jgi:hypothetical protein
MLILHRREKEIFSDIRVSELYAKKDAFQTPASIDKILQNGPITFRVQWLRPELIRHHCVPGHPIHDVREAHQQEALSRRDDQYQ